MKKYIIIPTYDEKENLPRLVEKIFSLHVPDLHIIVVDDNSPDGTGKIADELSRQYPLSVIHRAGKLGLGSAYLAGFKKAMQAGAEIVLEMDADFSHNPQDLPRLIKPIEEGDADVVIGSRRVQGGNVKGWSRWRNWQSRAAMSFARLILNLTTKDITAGFRAYRVQSLKRIDLDKVAAGGYAFQEEMIYLCERNNFKIKEIPVTFTDRRFGKSKLGLKDIVEFFATVFRLKFKK